MNDPQNIIGISSLISDDSLETQDILKLEQEIVSGSDIINNNSVDIANDYKAEMDKLIMDFTSVSQSYTSPAEESAFDLDKINESIDNSRSSTLARQHPSAPPLATPWQSRAEKDALYNRMTMEEMEQNRMQTMVGDIDEHYDVYDSPERDDDERASLMEQIDVLRDTLEDDGTNVSSVPVAQNDMSMKELHNIYKMLRLKNDRDRFRSFAEEVILAGAYGLEYLFDGSKEWFGRKPDLVGWPETVKVKLRRMRFHTSTFVQEVMKTWHLGTNAGWILFLELIPSMFLYSRNRKLKQSENILPDLQTKTNMQHKADVQFNDAVSILNSINKPV